MSNTNTRSIAFIALTIAVIAVSAWITVPIGPIPVTLQMFAFTFAIVLLTPKECLCAVGGYLLLGAIGIPVFSGMRGGIGVLMGPTGGFLWGYFLGAAAGAAFLYLCRKRAGQSSVQRKEEARQALSHEGGTGRRVAAFFRAFGVEVLAGVLFTLVSYVCGWAQYQVVASADPVQAFVVCIAPFVLIDFVKIVIAVLVADAVKKAIGR